MGQYFSDKTERGIQLVWMQFDKEKIQQGKRLLEEAASAGDAEAFCFLASTYMGARYVWRYAGLETDSREGARLLKEGIAKGSACAVLVALRCGELTPGVEKSMPLSLRQARDRVLENARAGHPFCQYLIGNSYFWWDVLRIDENGPRAFYRTQKECHQAMARKAVFWLEKAVAGGLPCAGLPLYGLYLGLEDGPADPAAARRTAEACARLGDPGWEELLARHYADDKNHAEAFHCFERAAMHGQITSLYYLGNYYQTGKGTAQSLPKAAACYEAGARGGDPFAQRGAAWMYFEGDLVPQDEAKAAYWAAQAANAEEGDREHAYPLLAHCLLHGLGCTRDVKKALALLQQAYAFCYAAGEDSCQYEDRSCRLLLRDLGEAYEKGLLGAVDLDQAVEHYTLAAIKFGDTPSRERLARFKKGLFGKWKLV